MSSSHNMAGTIILSIIYSMNIQMCYKMKQQLQCMNYESINIPARTLQIVLFLLTDFESLIILYTKLNNNKIIF